MCVGSGLDSKGRGKGREMRREEKGGGNDDLIIAAADDATDADAAACVCSNSSAHTRVGYMYQERWER